MPESSRVAKAYQLARQSYADWGIDTDRAMQTLAKLPIALHCWQGDDVSGFEGAGLTGGGILATGNYPGRARNGDELRADLDKAMSLIPTPGRMNLHAIYAETGGKKVERDALAPEHFARWMDWGKARKIGADFNPSFFSHPLAASGFTLSHADRGIREYWVRHACACRVIGAAMGRKLGSPCITNVWIPDGYKDTPVDRTAPRDRLEHALDKVFEQKLSPRHNLDALEGKLFGLASESYVVGSHEFYTGYAITRQKLLTLDTGHFHPTEVVADRVSSLLRFIPGLMLHVSRGVRWDSDHVVIMSDELQLLAREVVRSGALDHIYLSLDFFDASINRVAAWVIGARATGRALLAALLEPGRLRAAEAAGDYTSRLALLEEVKTLPLGAVWDCFCVQQKVPPGGAWLDQVRSYDKDIQAKRA